LAHIDLADTVFTDTGLWLYIAGLLLCFYTIFIKNV